MRFFNKKEEQTHEKEFGGLGGSSGLHGDHLGNAHNKAPNSGRCDKPDVSVSALPNSNSVNIALAKKAKIVTGSEMPPFFANTLKANGGDPKDSILALVVYLSGDTGITAAQDKVVRGYYKARLAVMNIGDGFSTGPKEAAYVMNDLVQPHSVIASHANEVSTVGGKVRPGSKTETFIKAVKMPVHIPLSGRTMEFDSAGRCAAGC